MGPTLSIMKRELGSYFNTPIGYVIIVFFLGLSTWLFLDPFFSQGVAEMRGYFGNLPFLFLFFIPAISMRLWSEERKLGTMELLMTMPMKNWNAVVGKYLAGMVFIIVMLALTFPIPAALAYLGDPDMGPIIGGYLGSLVLASIYLSIGAFASSLTSDQIVAFVVGLCASLILFTLGSPLTFNFIREDLNLPRVAEVVRSFGIEYHFESISRGVIDTRDVIYAVTVTGFFLFLNVLVIERRR
jgi:ABC-2 type transport system permease protein